MKGTALAGCRNRKKVQFFVGMRMDIFKRATDPPISNAIAIVALLNDAAIRYEMCGKADKNRVSSHLAKRVLLSRVGMKRPYEVANHRSLKAHRSAKLVL